LKILFLIITDKEGNINYERLEKITNDIWLGRAWLNRLPLGDEQEGRRSNKRNVETSVLLSADVRADSTQSGNKGAGETREIVKRQESLLKKYAKHEGIWIEPSEIEKWEYIDSGTESRVYKDPTNSNYVLKVGYNYRNFSETPLKFLDNRISLHNSIFIETKYDLVGFTETYGAIREVPGPFFAPVYRQYYIQGSVLKENELHLLQTEMEKRGFFPHQTKPASYRSKKYLNNATIFILF
jgi:hypothetical protein